MDAGPSDATSDAVPVAAMEIGPAGGTLSTDDGVVVEVPAGALAASTTITVTRVADAGGGTIGPVFELGPDGTVFAAPIVLTLPYDPAALGETPPGSLMLATDTGTAWSSAGWALVATGPGTVTGYVSHFSRWAVVPSADACAFDYGCFRTCCGVAEPDLCCNGPGRSSCECQSPRAFPDFVGCYATCIGTPQITNFANSECMNACCTGQGGTTRRGACLVDTGAEALAVLTCGAACAGEPGETTVCAGADLSFEACRWDVQLSPNLECGLSGVNSQFLQTFLRGVLPQTWGMPAVVTVTGGGYGSTTLTADLACVDTTDTGTISASWAGGQFSGSFSIGSSSGSVTVRPTW